jgi:hypothetical protein
MSELYVGIVGPGAFACFSSRPPCCPSPLGGHKGDFLSSIRSPLGQVARFPDQSRRLRLGHELIARNPGQPYIDLVPRLRRHDVAPSRSPFLSTNLAMRRAHC